MSVCSYPACTRPCEYRWGPEGRLETTYALCSGHRRLWKLYGEEGMRPLGPPTRTIIGRRRRAK